MPKPSHFREGFVIFAQMLSGTPFTYSLHNQNLLLLPQKAIFWQEEKILIGVTNARAKVGSIQVTPEAVNDPQTLQRFAQAQGELTSALSRLIAVAENYPQLKSDANFRELQAQLEGTENRIAVARNRYIQAVREYNVQVRSFPSNLTAMLFGFKEKAQFTVENEKEIAKPPKVEFGK